MCIEKCAEGDDEVPQCPFNNDEHHPSFYDDNHDSRPRDSNDREYNPWAGSQTPTEGKCNALLTNYEERYDEKRYCMGFPTAHFNVKDPSQFCKHHKYRESFMKHAKEMFKHGLSSQSIMHIFDKLDAMKKLLALGTFDSLVSDSSYDFAPERHEHYIDFSEYEKPIPLEIEAELDEDGRLGIEIPVPTDNIHRCLALYHAAIDEIKKINVNETLIAEGLDHTTEIPTEHGTQEDYDEHPLNLPYSRLVKDHKDHLVYGGIDVEGKTEDSVSVSASEDLILNVNPDPEAVSSDTRDMPLHQIDADDVDIEEIEVDEDE